MAKSIDFSAVQTELRDKIEDYYMHLQEEFLTRTMLPMADHTEHAKISEEGKCLEVLRDWGLHGVKTQVSSTRGQQEGTTQGCWSILADMFKAAQEGLPARDQSDAAAFRRLLEETQAVMKDTLEQDSEENKLEQSKKVMKGIQALQVFLSNSYKMLMTGKYDKVADIAGARAKLEQLNENMSRLAPAMQALVKKSLMESYLDSAQQASDYEGRVRHFATKMNQPGSAEVFSVKRHGGERTALLAVIGVLTVAGVVPGAIAAGLAALYSKYKTGSWNFFKSRAARIADSVKQHMSRSDDSGPKPS